MAWYSILCHSGFGGILLVPCKYAISDSLSDSERQKLRCRAMLILLAQRLGYNAVASRLDARREVVSLWRKRLSQRRLAGLCDFPVPVVLGPSPVSPRSSAAGLPLLLSD